MEEGGVDGERHFKLARREIELAEHEMPGLMALRKEYGGRFRDLGAVTGPLRDLKVVSDEAYLYLRLGLNGGGQPIDWSRAT